MNNVPRNYKPLSPWAYFGYNIIFNIPIIGFILLIIFSLDNSNINRRNYARSFWCIYILIVFLVILLVLLGLSIPNIENIPNIRNV